MLWVGLTGGIGAGKSAVSRRLVERGVALVDADRIAREVVQPGTPGQAAVLAAFGRQVLAPDGGLDRPALGRLVFGDEGARRRLNSIVHPLVGERTFELAAQAEQAGATVLVHDVPLLAENGLAPTYHLVVVVEAPQDVRIERLVGSRAMTPDEARARIAAQAADEDRRAVADVVIANDRTLAELHSAVDALLTGRVLPYAQNVGTGRPAPRGPVRVVEPDPGWAAAGVRLVARLAFVCGRHAVRVDHIGSTAVPGLAAKDVLDLQVECPTQQDAEALAPVLGEAGFPRVGGIAGDPPRPELDPDPAQYWKRLHRNADPGRAANVHVRVAGSTAARMARALPALLRGDPRARQRYEQIKRQLAARHPDDVDAYAEGKTPLLVPLLREAVLRGLDR